MPGGVGCRPHVLSQGPLGAVRTHHPAPQALAMGGGCGARPGAGRGAGSQVRSGEPPRWAQQKRGGGRAARRGGGGGASGLLEPHWAAARAERYKGGRAEPAAHTAPEADEEPEVGLRRRLAAPQSFLLRSPAAPPPCPRLPRDTDPRKFVRASAGRVCRARPGAQRDRAPQPAQEGAPRTPAAAAEPLARPGPRPRPPWAPRPAACRSRSASCWWGRCSAGPTPAAAPRCTRNRRFAMQM